MVRLVGQLVELVVFVVYLLKLAEDDSSGDDAVPIIVVQDIVVKLSESGHTQKHVFHGRVLVEMRKKLAVVAYAVSGLVFWETTKMAGCDRENGVQQMRMFSGSRGHYQMKVAAFVAQIELQKRY